MIKILYLLVLVPLLGKTQGVQTTSSTPTSDNLNTLDSQGIRWTEGLSWEEVKEKARRENKYIFLDCFTTWCGPCKKMDRDVYTVAVVGKLVNAKCIAVRVQMDKTNNDNSYIQSWYQNAKEISKRYLLEGYPTFLFLLSSGDIVHKEMGFKDAENFIAMVQTALTPGKEINDDYAEFTRLMASYKQGIIKYDRLPFMVQIAKKLGDTVSRQFLRLHERYVSALTANERYTKENIAFWSTLKITSKSRIVQFFYRDENQIDKIMKKKGYARAQVDKCIQNFIVTPFINKQLKDPGAKSGLITINNMTGTVVSNPTNYDEADWKQLKELILKDFGRSYAKRNLLEAKAIWYQKNRNWLAYARMSFEKYKNSPPDLENPSERAILNSLAWDIFLRINDKKLINEAITRMESIVQKWNVSDWVDTYANLLYKAGRKEEAIHWQEKAVSLEPTDMYSKIALEQMKKGEPTYGVK